MELKLIVWDERMHEIIDPAEKLETIVPDMHLTEGALWDYSNNRLLFNDIPVSNTMEWRRDGGGRVAFNNHSKANGQCLDPQGRLVVCEHASSHLSRCTLDGANYEVLATHYKGIEINSPNDVVCRSDGTIYFTDPMYGRQNAPAGIGRPIPSEMRPVYILNPETGDLRIGADCFANPNGLCFSKDEKLLYVNDSPNYNIIVFDVAPDGSLSNGREFAKTSRPGKDDTVPDGMKIDEAGNILCCGPDGLHFFDPDGTELGILVLSHMDTALNLAWGGADGRDLFITCIGSVMKTRTLTRGYTHIQYLEGVFPRKG